MSLSFKQYDLLTSFFAHVWAFYHDEGDNEFGFWALRLDELNISWAVQNITAELAVEWPNGFSCLRVLLQQKGFKFDWEWGGVASALDQFVSITLK
ncbi:MAG: hypothetical protein QM504_10170 [Pseudomonadota bacterium]